VPPKQNSPDPTKNRRAKERRGTGARAADKNRARSARNHGLADHLSALRPSKPRPIMTHDDCNNDDADVQEACGNGQRSVKRERGPRAEPERIEHIEQLQYVEEVSLYVVYFYK